MSYKFTNYRKSPKKRSINYQKAIIRNKQKNMVIRSEREAKRIKSDR